MGHNTKSYPRTAGQWISMWERELAMYVPLESGKLECIKLERVRRLNGEAADVLVASVEQGRFYVRFKHKRVYMPLNLPLLVHPVEAGAFGGFWILPGERA